ncbi:MAG: rod shape-determining protein MreC [Candidatus Pacebacteria bacterium]|nr:rod shape-determining protein MreC [Candidatus Paceibacterota bacterium]
MVKDFIFQRQNQKKAGGNGPRLLAVLFLFLVIFLFRFSPPSFLVRGFASLSRPVLLFKNSILDRTSSFLSIFYFNSYLVAENKMLINRLASLEGVEAELRLAKQNNQSLQESFGTSTVEKNSVLTAVILKPPRFPYDTLLADGGKNEKLQVGNLVYAGEHILIGEVSQVYGETSQIKFFSSPGQVTPAVLGVKVTPVELIGIGGGNFSIKIPRGVDVLEGDSVYSSNKNHDLIGIVGMIDTAPSDSFMKGVVRVPINLFELGYVLVEKNSLLIQSPL